MNHFQNFTVILALSATSAVAGSGHATDQKGAVHSDGNSDIVAAFDILAAHVHLEGRTATFHMTTNGIAGGNTPQPIGELAVADVYSYVWPTSLDPAVVGFEGGTGILALAATSHPDFDDTPLFDENGDGDPANDGLKWHSHWVVLAPTPACGDGALAVRDIEGEQHRQCLPPGRAFQSFWTVPVFHPCLMDRRSKSMSHSPTQPPSKEQVMTA